MWNKELKGPRIQISEDGRSANVNSTTPNGYTFDMARSIIPIVGRKAYFELETTGDGAGCGFGISSEGYKYTLGGTVDCETASHYYAWSGVLTRYFGGGFNPTIGTSGPFIFCFSVDMINKKMDMHVKNTGGTVLASDLNVSIVPDAVFASAFFYQNGQTTKLNAKASEMKFTIPDGYEAYNTGQIFKYFNGYKKSPVLTLSPDSSKITKAISNNKLDIAMLKDKIVGKKYLEFEVSEGGFIGVIDSNNVNYQISTASESIFEGFESNSYGGDIICSIIDGDFIYAGGATTRTVRKYHKDTLHQIAESPSYGGEIRAMTKDDNFIYVVGDTTQRIRKYDKDTLEYISEGPVYGGNYRAIVIDGSFIYAGGLTTNQVIKYNKDTLAVVTGSPSYGGTIIAIAVDDDFVYAGGDVTRTVRKYNKSDMTFVSQTPSYGGDIYTIALDQTHIYAAGTMAGDVKSYKKSDMTLAFTSSGYGGSICTVVVDDSSVYVGGMTLNSVMKLRKSDLNYQGLSTNYGGGIMSILQDNDLIYVSGLTTGRIRKYRKANVQKAEVNTSGTVRDIVYDLDFGYSVAANSLIKFKKADMNTVATKDIGYSLSTLILDDNFIYLAGDPGSTTNKIRKHRKDNLDLAVESPSYGGDIFALVVDSDFIYAGGGLTRTVRKYNKSDLSYVSESSSYGETIRAMVADSEFIYVAGSANNIKKYRKDTLTFVSESPLYGGVINTIDIDSDFVFVGGSVEKVRKYRKDTLAYVTESPAYGGIINRLKVSEFCVFVGGATNNTVRKYRKDTLQLLGDSSTYGGIIRTLNVDNDKVFIGGENVNTIKRFSTLPTIPPGKYIKSSGIIGVAVDADNRKVYFRRNGVWDIDPVTGNGLTISASAVVYAAPLSSEISYTYDENRYEIPNNYFYFSTIVRMLLEHGGKYFRYFENAWHDIGNQLSEEMFDLYGFGASKVNVQTLSYFDGVVEFILKGDATEKTLEVKVDPIIPSRIPKDLSIITTDPLTINIELDYVNNPTIVQALGSKNLQHITDIKDINISGTVTDGSIIKVVASTDNGLIYYGYDTQWRQVDSLTIEEVMTKGINMTDVNNLGAIWDTLPGLQTEKQIKFAYLLDQSNEAPKVATDSVEIVYGANGYYDKVDAPNMKVDYIDNNLLRVQLKESALYKINLVQHI